MTGDWKEILYTLPTGHIQGQRENSALQLGSGDMAKVLFSGEDIGYDENSAYKLRVCGEVSVNPDLRHEQGFKHLYKLIDDSLDSVETYTDGYSLKLSSRGEEYPRRAYYKAVLSEDKNTFRLGIWCKKDNVKILPGGSLQLIAEIYRKRAGRHPKDVSGTPDEAYAIDIGEGTGEWQESCLLMPVAGAACILVYMNLENYTGTLWLQNPSLADEDDVNLLPPFAPGNEIEKDLQWLGHNLSKKEWPEFEIVLNGQTVFMGEAFQRLYRWPVSEFDIPYGLIKPSDNELTVKYVSQYFNVLPFSLKKIEFVKLQRGFTVVGCPKVVSAGETFAILVKVPERGTSAGLKSSSRFIQAVEESIMFDQAGLNIIRFKALYPGDGETTIPIGIEGNIYDCTVERVVEREDDGILTSTGDSIYISQDIGEMEYYLSWYLGNQIGNCIFFRPNYAWNGTRVLKEKVWERMVKLCNDLGLFYCHMIDGRDLPGSRVNPDRAVMKGQYFIGDQAHEKDGSFYYWGPRELEPSQEIYFDIWSRTANRLGIFPLRTPVRTDNGTFQFLHPYSASNMKEAAENFIYNVGFINDHATRHTGPSVLFRYFYQAGLEWLGAETMYGPQDIILSALRGASKAYNRNSFGSHLAIQWSTVPHDTEQRYRRYLLGLYLCYMQGVDQINTEEGLWRLEAGFSDHERFDVPCIRHKNIQQKFYRFIQTHSRRGKMHVPLAFVHGRYDGWVCLRRMQVWSQSGEEWKFGPPEESWDLLKVFYPFSLLEAIYRYPCPDSPQGFFSGTPYGNVDIVPIEADASVYKSYRVLSFLGWNSAETAQIDKLVEYVRNGGVLLLGWPHLFCNLKRSDAMGDEPEVLDNDGLRRLIGAELLSFCNVIHEGRVIKAGNIELKGAEALIANAEGSPLVIENRIGKGRVIFVNIKAYPAEKEVKDIYTELLMQLGRQTMEQEKKRGWLECSPETGFTVYDRDGARTIYFMYLNWWDAAGRPDQAKLLWDNGEFAVDVDRENINILTLSDHWGVLTRDNETDVISIEDNGDEAEVRLQGYGTAEIHLFNRTYGRKGLVSAIDGQGQLCVTERVNDCSWRTVLKLKGVTVLKLKASM